MSGGSSGSYQDPYNLDPNDFSQFRKSNIASGFDSNVLDLIQNKSYMGPIEASMKPGGQDQYKKLNAVVSAFSKWRASRDDRDTDYKSYLQAASDNPGREATILTAPGKSVLG